jgi:arabinofuranosyltransferase
MAEVTSKLAKLRFLPLVVLAALYIAWAAVFISRSAAEAGGGHYFCLFDDAMVSLRYAWNLAHGEGLVWNPGERVEGITSFLFTLTMTPGALFFDKSGAALFVQVTGIVLVLAVALLARRLGQSLPGKLALGTRANPALASLLDGVSGSGLLIAAAVLVYYPLSYWSLMGMETGLLTALALGALLLAIRLGPSPRGSKVLGLLLGLMFATRPDAAAPAVLILAFRALWILRAHRRPAALRPWVMEVAVFACIALGLTLFRWSYYGSPLPNTYQLKMADWPLRFRLQNGWKFVVPFLETTRRLILFALCSVLLHRDGRRFLLLCFAACIVACQIWVGGDAWSYWRMLVPGVMALIVLAVDGAVSLGSLLVASVVRRKWRSLVLGLGALSMAWALYLAEQPFMDELQMKVPAYTVSMNAERVKEALELSQYAEPQASVAVFAAGVVPYYSGLRGIDALGKSDPHVARLPGRGYGQTVTPGHNKFDLRYSILKLRPDAIYDALAWVRYDSPDIYEFVQSNYVQQGSFRLLRGSPHVRWDRLSPQ